MVFNPCMPYYLYVKQVLPVVVSSQVPGEDSTVLYLCSCLLDSTHLPTNARPNSPYLQSKFSVF